MAQAVGPLFDLHDADAKVIWGGHIDTGRDNALGAATSGRGARVVVHDRAGRTVLSSRLVDSGVVDAFGLYL